MTGGFLLVRNANDQLPLLGRDWLCKLQLNWSELSQTTRTESVYKLEIQSIKEEFADVFKEELGLLIGLEAEIELKESTSPNHGQFYLHYVPKWKRSYENRWPMVNYNQLTRVNGQRL